MQATIECAARGCRHESVAPSWVFRTHPCSSARSLVCRGSSVVVAYAQPWAGGAKAVWTFTLTVGTIQAPVIEQEPALTLEPGLR